MSKGFIARRKEGEYFPLSVPVSKEEYDSADKGTEGEGIFYAVDPEDSEAYIKTYSYMFTKMSAIAQLDIIHEQPKLQAATEGKFSDIQEIAEVSSKVVDLTFNTLRPKGHQFTSKEFAMKYLDGDQQQDLMNLLQELSGAGNAKQSAENKQPTAEDFANIKRIGEEKATD